MATILDRARRYLDRLPPAVAGSRGHDATFAAATACVRFGLNEGDAWQLLLEYNARCQPPWSESDLRHKLRDAFKLVAPDTRFVDRRPASTTDDSPEAKRARWPRFEMPTKGELHRIGELRNIGEAGLHLAVERELLWCADYHGQRSWLVTDSTRRAAQARRLDGQPWHRRDAEPAKALTLAGSIGSWPVGIEAAKPFPKVLLCEGGPDLLAAHHFIAIEDAEFSTAAVGLLGGSHRLAESVLPHFAGKTVRVIPHTDEAGKRAAARWGKALLSVASKVDVLTLDGLRRTDGEPVKDLNDATSIGADDFEEHRFLWNLCPE